MTETILDGERGSVEKSIGEKQTTDIVKVKSRKKFFEGEDVLSRWSDGLFYLGNIIKVDKIKKKCLVRFEDNSEYWAMFKDLQKGPYQGSDIICSLCDGGHSDIPNEIVICDNCGFGFHQKCHNPVIPDEVLQPEFPWICRQCSIVASTKKGSGVTKGTNVKAMQGGKQTLPYDPKLLDWNSQHTTNSQECYCYCGGPGDWYIKMVQCNRCKQWFHEACVQCLEKPLLMGDRYYIFVCSLCNLGHEFSKRLEIKWRDLVHLVIFNLTLQHNKKYFDLFDDIYPYIFQNWENLQLPSEYYKISESKCQEDIRHSLENNSSRFQCGKEIKKRTTLWGLRIRVPPPVPVVIIPTQGIINNKALQDIKILSRKGKTYDPVLTSPVPKRYNTAWKKKRRKTTSDIPLNVLLSSLTSFADLPPPTLSVSSSLPKRGPLSQSQGSVNSMMKGNRLSLPPNIRKAVQQEDPKGPLRKQSGAQNSKGAKGKETSQNGKRGRSASHETSKNKINTSRNIARAHQNYKNCMANAANCKQRSNSPSERNVPADLNIAGNGTLDSFIPVPVNFKGKNNPFCNMDPIPLPGPNPVGRPLKRKLSQEDIRISKKGEIKTRKRKNRRKDNGLIPVNTNFSSLLQHISPRRQATNGLSKIVLNGQLINDIVDDGQKAENRLRSGPLSSVNTAKFSLNNIKSSVNNYFGIANRIADGERFKVLARRVTADGNVHYLLEWEGLSP